MQGKANPKPNLLRMKCTVLLIAIVTSCITSVFGIPTTTTQNDLSDVIGIHTVPQRVQMPDVQTSVNDTGLFIFRTDVAQEWICMVGLRTDVWGSSDVWTVAVGSSKALAMNAALQGGCGGNCENAACVQRGCVAWAMANSVPYSVIYSASGYGSRNADGVVAEERALATCVKGSGGYKCSAWYMCSVNAN